MAEALKINTALTHVDFGVNRFGDAGAKALAEMLSFNTTLSFINLTSSYNDDEGAQALGTAWGSMANQNLTISAADQKYRNHLPFVVEHFDYEKNAERTEAVMVEARDHQVEVRRRRELLLAFGMGLHDRLGGREDGVAAEQPGGGQMSCTGCTFHGLDENIFRLVGKGLAYV